MRTTVLVAIGSAAFADLGNRLLAADGATTDAVDASGFYILATCGTSAAPCNATRGPVVTTAFVSVALVGG